MKYYPASAIAANIEGKVQLSFRIKTNGSVAHVVIVKSSGNADLDSASIRCVKTWHYRPATRNGKKVEVPWQVMVGFRIAQSK
jgi:TonB family protein